MEIRIDMSIEIKSERERGREGDREKTMEVKTWRSEQGEKEK